MTDLKTDQSGGVATAGTAGIVVDPSKSAEQYIKEAEALFIIPKLVRDDYPDLVKLIYETESMNEEEREYWMQILPIMTEDQITKFRDILVNEKEQLAKLDDEYEQEMARISSRNAVEFDEAELKAQRETLAKKEASEDEEEKEAEAELLGKLEDM